MSEARLVESVSKGVTFTKVIRGKLNKKDKHWGMRSNMEFRKRLEVRG